WPAGDDRSGSCGRRPRAGRDPDLQRARQHRGAGRTAAGRRAVRGPSRRGRREPGRDGRSCRRASGGGLAHLRVAPPGEGGARGGNAYARLLLGVPVRDATGGYRAYRRQVLETIPLDDVASQGYCFQVDLVWRAWRSGFRVVEVPIRFSERVAGVSKMNRAIVAEALWQVTVWGLRSGRSRSARKSPLRDKAST